MAANFKQVTNLTGLAACPNPHHILNRLYKRISKLLLKLPENSTYRKYTQDIVNQRTAIVNSTENIKELEEKIGCGQVEEVIEQARKELDLIQTFLLTRPWESLISSPPPNQWKWPVK